MTGAEAHDLAGHLPVLRAWVEQTAARLELPSPEGDWLEAARALLAQAEAGSPAALERGRDLPELSVLRAAWVAEKQQAWVDALERLHAGVVFHGGSRSPLLEALFPNLKLASLRRAQPEAAGDFWADFQRRARSGYVQRQLSHDAHAPLAATLEEALRRWSEWTEAQRAPLLEGSEAEVARQALSDLGEALERRAHQARLLIEAALTGVSGGAECLKEAPRLRRRTRPAGRPTPA